MNRGAARSRRASLWPRIVFVSFGGFPTCCIRQCSRIGGLKSALSTYVDGFARQSHITVALHFPAELDRLPENVETTLFRVVQKSLTNIHRHSGRSTASIRIVRRAAKIVLTARDRGRSILKSPPAGSNGKSSSAPGVGIESIRETGAA